MIDNEWVVNGLQLLVDGYKPGADWDHADLWFRIASLLSTRTSPVTVEKWLLTGAAVNVRPKGIAARLYASKPSSSNL